MRGPRRRLRGERGSAFVAALVVMFTVTGVAAVWLARDVNQRVSDRSALQSIAFQAARAGAQQIDLGELRSGGAAGVAIDESAARTAARASAERLADRYDVDIRIVDQGFGDDQATWTVTIAKSEEEGPVDLDEVLWATGIAHAETGS